MTNKQHTSRHAGEALPQRLLLSLLLCCLVATITGTTAFAEIDDDSTDAEDAPPAGAIKFMVSFTKGINSDRVDQGQKIEGKLEEDLKVNGQLVAPAGSKIYGHIEELKHSRSLPKSVVSNKRRFRMRSSLVIKFDRIVTPAKVDMNIVGQACKQHSIFSNGHTARVILVGENGELLQTGDTSMVEDKGMGMSIPKSWVKVKGRFQIDIEPGDQLIVQATMPYGLSVSASVMKNTDKKSQQ